MIRSAEDWVLSPDKQLKVANQLAHTFIGKLQKQQIWEIIYLTITFPCAEHVYLSARDRLYPTTLCTERHEVIAKRITLFYREINKLRDKNIFKEATGKLFPMLNAIDDSVASHKETSGITGPHIHMLLGFPINVKSKIEDNIKDIIDSCFKSNEYKFIYLFDHSRENITGIVNYNIKYYAMTGDSLLLQHDYKPKHQRGRENLRN